MKRIITLGLCLFFLGTANAQKLDYDNDSKWFFGFNLGGTWNTTDVKNKTNFGWGITLGRAFNYNYGKKISYDVRFRYLGGNWYGQDYSITDVANNNLYDPAGNVAATYGAGSQADSAGYGYTVNNFNTEAHELGLELVIHLNSLRERTGFDPYIFGGVGVAWNQTYGDLYSRLQEDSLSQSFYHYDQDGISKTELGQLTDEIYDSPLDGSSEEKYNVNFIPSVGIGLAYQVGPKFSIGLEHRTMFFLENTFDGYAGDGSKWGGENDLYHYSGLTMKFHIGKKNKIVPDDIRPDAIGGGGGGGALPITNATEPDAPCKNPVVDFRQPNGNAITVYSNEYDLKAKITQIVGREDIQFSVNGNASTNYTFNTSNGNFESRIILVPGHNQIVLSATNECGSDSETRTINYIDCRPPNVRFTNPSIESIEVSNASFVINALLKYADGMTYYVNGVSSSNYMYNPSTGELESSIVLRKGLNTVKIAVQNSCGNYEQTVRINFLDCAKPYVNIDGSNNSITVDQPSFTLNADVGNVASKSEVEFKLNGTLQAFSLNVGTFRFNSTVTLRPGANTLTIKGQNECGVDQQTITVNYVQCEVPVVTIVAPGNNTSTQSPNITIKAKVTNITAASGVLLKVNNVTVTGGTYNASTQIFEKSIALIEGQNTISVAGSNNCGRDEKQVVINKRPCQGPSISIVQPTVSTTQDNSLLVKATVLNVTSASQIALKLNGTTVVGGTYNVNTHIYQKTVTLQEGSNSINLTATNDCSTAKKGVTIKYVPCSKPDISMISPMRNNINVSEASFLFRASVTNTSGVNQTQLLVNGSVSAGATYNPSTSIYENRITLNEGRNELFFSVTSDCGQALENLVITLTLPVEEKMTICHHPPGNPTNTQQIEIPVSAWPAHEAHGDTQGACPEEKKITICHHPPGEPTNTQEIEIPISAWPAHEAHGDTRGKCPVERPGIQKPGIEGGGNREEKKTDPPKDGGGK